MASTKVYRQRTEFIAELLEKQFPPRRIRGLEIGVYKGDFSHYLLHRVPRLYMTMVDPYLQYDEFKKRWSNRSWNALYARVCFKMALLKGRAVLLRMTSEEAAALYDGGFDFVFIDALHDYPHVKQDLELWEPRVAKGGIVSGHDYSMAPDAGGGGVIQAVDEYAAKIGVTPKFGADTVWYWIKE